jgi:hypothetical protein
LLLLWVSQDLLADWGLGPASMRAIEDACSGVRVIAPMLDAAAPFGAPPWGAPQPAVALVPLHGGVVHGGSGAADHHHAGEGNAMVN